MENLTGQETQVYIGMKRENDVTTWLVVANTVSRGAVGCVVTLHSMIIIGNWMKLSPDEIRKRAVSSAGRFVVDIPEESLPEELEKMMLDDISMDLSIKKDGQLTDFYCKNKQ